MIKYIFLACIFLVAMLGAGCLGLGSDDATSAPVQASGGDAAQPAGSGQAGQAGQMEITIGMTPTQVLKLLGQADSINALEGGGESWMYNGRQADFIYAAGRSLLIGEYAAPARREGPLSITIVFDAGRKVSDFNYLVMPL